MSGTGHPVWGSALQALRRSLYAQQVYSSMLREWETAGIVDESALAPLRHWTEVSTVCRVEALGHCIRLHFLKPDGEAEGERLTTDLVSLLYKARRADAKATRELETLLLARHVPEPWSAPVQTWHAQRRVWLKASLAAVKARVSPEVYERGKAMRS
ncbi:hypothetical protein AAC03nite_27030 [Alicyclobacillus acidoterrestris]|uniref:hypothetical protein n=1 Tax=Alicyclobacillus suci TaxID=2816080 RepID=UPI0011917F68|nr:hypothetical protein [Alicyclobacillus suci]GEO26918.1 hypothetical protein AAC03nite_27030 [Alicyclobacillus acidoterrestris]